MIAFYDVDSEYVDFLKTIDSKVPNIKYDGNNKFVCGIVFKINNIEYYAPVSHMKIQQRTNMLIYKDEEPISSIRFSFMFPCPIEYLNQKDFSKEEEKYQNLLRKELHYCNINREKIKKIANEVYKLGIKEKTRKKFNICNFLKLEEQCLKYMDFKE